jgi:hypothetical protein
MALNGVEIVIITVMAVVAAAWTLILLFDRTGVSRRPVFSALVLVILGLLGVVFYGIYEDKSNLWWIIPTVGISLITLILVFRIPFLRGRQKILQDETRQEEIRQQVISENSDQDFAKAMISRQNLSTEFKTADDANEVFYFTHYKELPPEWISREKPNVSDQKEARVFDDTNLPRVYDAVKGRFEGIPSKFKMFFNPETAKYTIVGKLKNKKKAVFTPEYITNVNGEVLGPEYFEEDKTVPKLADFVDPNTRKAYTVKGDKFIHIPGEEGTHFFTLENHTRYGAVPRSREI